MYTRKRAARMAWKDFMRLRKENKPFFLSKRVYRSRICSEKGCKRVKKGAVFDPFRRAADERIRGLREAKTAKRYRRE